MKIVTNTLVLFVVAVFICACNGSDSAAPGSDTSDNTFTGESELPKVTALLPAVTPSNKAVVLPPQTNTKLQDLGPIVWPLPLPKADTMAIQVGVRPYFLVDDMNDGDLKTKLKSCADGPFKRTDFAIAHRGAPLQFPEHTKEGYLAAIRMGAGILECDVTVTKDKQLVCRHSQCDLATTTNILTKPDLAKKCEKQFSPGKGASCCTSDITLAEFKTLKGKMDASNSGATTVEEFQGGTLDWRTDLYAIRSGTLMSHAESIALFDAAGVKMTPELKSMDRSIPGYSLDNYRQQIVDEYKAAKIDPSRVSIQSFDLADVRYWIKNEPDFGKGASYLVKNSSSFYRFWKPFCTRRQDDILQLGWSCATDERQIRPDGSCSCRKKGRI